MQESFERMSAANATPSSARYIRLGSFQIDQQRQEITRNGETLKLQGKVYQVLMALLEKPGEVVTREEIRQRLWPAETHVNFDANVNTTVNKLRLALGDSSDNPVYIETIPRKGYCLLMQPETSATPLVTKSVLAEVVAPAASAPTTHAKPKTAVWIIVSVIGLIVGGMLIGAALTRVWISHFGSVSRWP